MLNIDQSNYGKLAGSVAGVVMVVLPQNIVAFPEGGPIVSTLFSNVNLIKRVEK